MNNRITKTLRGKAGFTLVELIVVIAILGILAGVGTVGYSGYIKKANQAVDQQLVASVKNALQLGAVSNFNESTDGYVVLSTTDAPVVSNEQIEAYLKAAFGDDLSGLLLKYDGWAIDSDMLTLVSSQKYAGYVNSSSYLQNSTISDLLNNVEIITYAATGLLDSYTGTAAEKYTALKGTLGAGYIEMGASESVGIFDTTTEEVKTGEDVDKQMSNLMVLSVANELGSLDEDTVVAMMQGEEVSAEVSLAAQLATRYAIYKAAASNLGEEGTTQLNQMNANLQSAKNLTDVQNAMASFVQDSEGNQKTEFVSKLNAYMFTKDSNDNNTFTDTFTKDAQAFAAIMGGVASVKDDYLNADSLANADLYTSDAVVADLNSYLTAAALKGNEGVVSAENGQIVITMIGGNVVVSPEM